MRLEKWVRLQTVEFFTSYRNESGHGIENPVALYDELASLVGERHVILQRPFLVYTMAKMLSSTPGSAQDIVKDIGDSGLQVVPRVIKSFLKREVEEKWRDPNGQPYLTLDEHIHLLAAIADEMWTQLGKSLLVELLQLVTETVAEELSIPIPRRVQIVERVKAHAMFPAGAADRSDYCAFEHDEFLDYFLAVRLCELLKSSAAGNLRRFLERYSLPVITAKWTAVIEDWAPESIGSMISTLSTMSKSEVRSTYLKQNAGLIAARLAGAVPEASHLGFESMYFEGDHWAGSTLAQAQFLRCVFNGVDLSDCDWNACRFVECQFQSLTINQKTRLSGCAFDEQSRVSGLLRAHEDDDSMRIFVPEICQQILMQCGAEFEHRTGSQLKLDLQPVPDEIRSALNRFLRTFSRSSGATDNVIKMRLGPKLHKFRTVVLPALLDHGIIRTAEYRGSGSQDRYELNYPVDTILSAEDPTSSAPPQLVAFWNALRK